MLDFKLFTSPILLHGDECTAYRDPAVFYCDGVFHLFFTLVETETDGRVFMYLAGTTSPDLRQFTPVTKITARDQSLNFSSPGNIISVNGRYTICCQTYCRENGEKFGNHNSRIWRLDSPDLIHWGTPELLKVKGDEVANADMGRLIDPYLIQAPTGEWYCFFKESNGVSFASSGDLRHWHFRGHTDSGENVCVLRDGDIYRMWHSPVNGIGEKISTDLLHWQDTGRLITLGQNHWEWARGRLTAGMVLDLRGVPEVGKALLFFHGTGPEDERTVFDTRACIGFAWSDDLNHWQYIN